MSAVHLVQFHCGHSAFPPNAPVRSIPAEQTGGIRPLLGHMATQSAFRIADVCKHVHERQSRYSLHIQLVQKSITTVQGQIFHVS